MPGGQCGRRVGIEKFRREPAVKLNIGTGGRLEELAKITAEILGGVGVVGRLAKRLAKRIVQRDVEERTADERGEPGHRFACRLVLVETLQQAGKFGLLKIVAKLERVTGCIELGPGLGQVLAELLQRLVP